MSAKHSTKTLAIRGVVSNWAGRFCGFAITFVVTPLLLAALGDEAYGVWAIVMSFASYYALADCGLQMGCVKYLSQFHALNDRPRLEAFYATALRTYSALAAAVVVASIPAAWCFPLLFEMTGVDATAARWAVFLIGVNVAVRLQAQVFDAGISALKRFDVGNAVAVTAQVAQAAATIAAVTLGYGVLGMAVATLGTTVLARGAAAVIAIRLLGLGSRPAGFDRESFGLLWRFGSMNVVRKSTDSLHSHANPVVIGLALGPASVTTYVIANSLVTKVRSLTGSVSTVALPVASELDARGDRAGLLKLLVQVPRLMVSLALSVAVLLILYGDEFLDLWLGPGYAVEAMPVLTLLALAFVTDMTSGGLGATLTGCGRIGAVTWVTAAKAAIGIPLSVALVGPYGPAGAAGATLVTSAVTNLGLFPWIACRHFGISWLAYVPRVFARPLAAAVPLVLVVAALDRFTHPARTLEWLAWAGCAGAVAAVSTVLVVLDASARQAVLAAFRPRGRGRVAGVSA